MKPQEITLRVPHPLANRIRKLAEREGITFAAAGIRLWDEVFGTREPDLCLKAMEV
jgi:hypothetical protein